MMVASNRAVGERGTVFGEPNTSVCPCFGPGDP